MEAVERQEPSFTAGELVQPLWDTVWRFLRKLGIELPHDPASPLLRIYLKHLETFIRKNICAHVHRSITHGGQDLRQPRCPSATAGRRRRAQAPWVPLGLGKDGTLPFAPTRVDLENVMLSKMSQTGKAKNRILPLTCGL